MAIMKALSGRPELHVHEDDFDADPWLLNTPAGIVDLRDATVNEHDPEKLMRNMTAVAPDMPFVWDVVLGNKHWSDGLPLYWMVAENIARKPGDSDAEALGEIRPGHVEALGR